MAPRIPLPPLGRSQSERPVAVLDVGTSKVSALIALVGGDGPPRIIGSGQKPCMGLKRGTVTDFDKAEMAIRGAIDQAERAAGMQMDSVVASFAAGNMASSMASAEIDIAGASITPTDMVTLRQAGRAAIDPRGRSVVHALPALYTLDGLPGVESPLGLHADRLGMDIHVVTADTPAILNFTRAVAQSHLGISTLVASPLAASLAVLDEEERDIGVALIDIGAGMTSIAVHKFGIAVGVATVPMGSADITDDIAAAFDTKRSIAERLKTFDGAAVATIRDQSDPVLITPSVEDGSVEARKVPRAQLVGVIRTRLDMLFGEIGKALLSLGFVGPQARRIVLTGGGSDLRSIADYAGSYLGCNVRIGRPRGLTGLPVAQEGPAFATLAGLVLFAQGDPGDVWHAQVSGEAPSLRRGFGGVIEKLWGSL
ncbi:cell division protein FtsA [Sandarakinorhabdus limnophila]|uniref:cell division protein FtsA n=1 Tax=Sandarakinorhabdus limnophila TaxID=210512 RepID=UPI00058C06F6|nr:cell division protein FtsA [Sandarakinorhabdus limnophila]